MPKALHKQLAALLKSTKTRRKDIVASVDGVYHGNLSTYLRTGLGIGPDNLQKIAKMLGYRIQWSTQLVPIVKKGKPDAPVVEPIPETTSDDAFDAINATINSIRSQ